MPARAAGQAVWKLRLDHDPSASAGIPPHVTLMYPFLPPPHLTETVIQDLERLAGNVTPFDFALTNIREFEQGVVYLEPEPAKPFVNLSNEIGRRFGLLPFAGEFGDVLVPHLTLDSTMPPANAYSSESRPRSSSAVTGSVAACD